MSKTSVRKIKFGAEINETGINTVLTIMPPKCYLFQAWYKAIIFFTLGIIQVVVVQPPRKSDMITKIFL